MNCRAAAVIYGLSDNGPEQFAATANGDARVWSIDNRPSAEIIGTAGPRANAVGGSVECHGAGVHDDNGPATEIEGIEIVSAGGHMHGFAAAQNNVVIIPWGQIVGSTVGAGVTAPWVTAAPANRATVVANVLHRGPGVRNRCRRDGVVGRADRVQIPTAGWLASAVPPSTY